MSNNNEAVLRLMSEQQVADMLADSYPLTMDSVGRLINGDPMAINLPELACIVNLALAATATVAKDAVKVPCWSCNYHYTADERLHADGRCPRCDVEIELDEGDAFYVPPKPEASAEQPAGEVVAWMTEDGRVATDQTKKSSMAKQSAINFNIPLCIATTAPDTSALADSSAAPQWNGSNAAEMIQASKDFANGWKAALAAPSPTGESLSVPDGLKLVPIEPTDEMRTACIHRAYQHEIDEDWDLMLAAAPTVPGEPT